MNSTNESLKIVLASWAPFIGGAEVAVERLALGLAAAGHDVLLVVGTRGEALERFEAAGIRCEVIEQRFTDKLGWLKYRRARRQWVDLLRRERPDLVHSNDLPTHQLVGDAAGRLGIPRVCHHRWVFERGAIDWLNKFGAERHLFVSQALQDHLCGESETLRESSLSVVYDGLPLPLVPSEADRAAAKAALGVENGKSLILFAGQIIERKGVADLLHGWRALAPRWSARAELAIVGDDLAGQGAYRKEMEQLAAQLEVPVRFLGFQKNVPQWLTASDIVMVPSHVEPLGNATLEAMSFARPVIGGRAGGIPEMIVDGETGILIPPKSPGDLAAAIERLLNDPAQGVRMGVAARVLCEEKFSIDAHVRAVLEEYQTVLQPAGAAV